jgi:GDPmannose 4,6-dehydratase
MGNMDALRDWGHAKDYVRMQWMMLQQEVPEDFVIASGVQFTVRQFIIWAASHIGFTIKFQGSGIDEVGVVAEIQANADIQLKVGDVVVRIDEKYFRPTEVESLLGDPSNAKNKLGWQPEISVQDMCREMVDHDILKAKEHALLLKNGFSVSSAKE